ncbi:hypothetical protein AAVH_31573 [Aphelenchoides avenae]|nr:hypothetical protein AAVH_31573 [Aphelenchus avenae]
MVVLRCSFALAFAVLAVQTSALLPQQPATKQSTITAIVEVPQSGKANSAAQKGCEELNKKVNTAGLTLKVPLAKTIADNNEESQRAELFKTAIDELFRRPNDELSTYSQPTKKAVLTLVEDTSDKVILPETIRLGNVACDLPNVTVDVTFSYVDRIRPDYALLIASQSGPEIQIVMEHHPRHQEVLKKLSGEWKKEEKRVFYATEATPTAVMNAFAVQGYTVVGFGTQASYGGDKMFWTLKLVV